VRATLCIVIDSADALSEPEFQPDYDPVHRFSAWLERAGKAEATVEAYHADVADLVRAFVPRPLESDPEALRLPFFHNNDDFEEIMSTHYGRMVVLDDRIIMFANPEDAAEYISFDLQAV